MSIIEQKELEAGTCTIAQEGSNFSYLLEREDQVFLIDPGFVPATMALIEIKMPTHILLTHAHPDHCAALKSQSVAQKLGHLPLIGGKHFTQKEQLLLEELGIEALATPGHSDDHRSFLFPYRYEPLLFCGDLLFALGCGRLCGGERSAEQMIASLKSILRLDEQTLLFPGHDYFETNARFASLGKKKLLAKEATASQALTTLDQITGFTLGEEKKRNPFLLALSPLLEERLELTNLCRALQISSPQELTERELWIALRRAKDRF